MNIIAYTYEADYHCIDCTVEWAHKQSLKRGGSGAVRISENDLVEFQVTYFNGTVPDRACVPGAVFSTDEWQEFDESYLAENPTQYLACGDCHEIIETYSTSEVIA